jgi:hypothetical protein
VRGRAADRSACVVCPLRNGLHCSRAVFPRPSIATVNRFGLFWASERAETVSNRS